MNCFKTIKFRRKNIENNSTILESIKNSSTSKGCLLVLNFKPSGQKFKTDQQPIFR